MRLTELIDDGLQAKKKTVVKPIFQFLCVKLIII